MCNHPRFPIVRRRPEPAKGARCARVAAAMAWRPPLTEPGRESPGLAANGDEVDAGKPCDRTSAHPNRSGLSRVKGHAPSFRKEAKRNVKLHLSLAMVTTLALTGVLTCACGHTHSVTSTVTPGGSSLVAVPTGRAATEPEQTGAYLGVMAGPWVGPDIRPRVFLLGADRVLGV
jgi:hypothetical protein